MAQNSRPLDGKMARPVEKTLFEHKTIIDIDITVCLDTFEILFFGVLGR